MKPDATEELVPVEQVLQEAREFVPELRGVRPGRVPRPRGRGRLVRRALKPIQTVRNP
jgi:hypothetical protein